MARATLLVLLVLLLAVASACAFLQPPLTTTPTATPITTPTATALPSSTPLVTPTPSPTPRALPVGPGELPPIAEVVAKVQPAVVGVATETQTFDIFRRPIRSVSTGTGVIFDPNGYIVTNNHVIENATRIRVTLSDGDTLEASLVGADPLSDLAVLRVETRDPLPTLAFAPPESLRAGDWVIAIGNALALPGGPTVTVGVVGALDRIIVVGDLVYHDLVQTDAAINEGNSGGPLVNLQGQVVGINTIAVKEAQGIGFAISNFTIAPVVQSILQNGRVIWPWLGVGVDNISPGKALELGMSSRDGVLILGVEPGGPAAAARIAPEDVLLALDDNPTPNVRALQKLMRGHYQVGQDVTVTVLRNGVTQQFRIKLEEMPRQ